MTTGSAAKKYNFVIILAAIAATGFIIYTGYSLAWTGFSGKTLWNWLDLLIIPLALALGVFILNRAEVKIGRELQADRIRESLLETYLDRMADILTKQNLIDSQPESEIRTLARTRTLTVLRRLDGVRKGIVIRFLYELGLIKRNEAVSEDLPGHGEAIIDLRGADLTDTDLEGADLYGIYLRDVNLSGANLNNTILQEADFQYSNLAKAKLANSSIDKALFNGCDLSQADLNAVHFEGTRFEGADLGQVMLSNAFTVNAHFEKANLENANIQNTSLSSAKFFDAVLYGADLSGTDNIDREELAKAYFDDRTKFPEYISKDEIYKIREKLEITKGQASFKKAQRLKH